MRTKYLGYSASYYNRKHNNEINNSVNQNRCIFHPRIDNTLAEGVLSLLEIDKYSAVNITKPMCLDAFKLFYLKDKEVIMNPSKYWFHHFLSKCDNHILALITNNNPGFSYIAAHAILEVLYKYLRKENPTEEELNESLSSGNSLFEDMQKLAKRAMGSARKSISDVQQTSSSFGASKDFGKDLQSAQILGDPNLLKSIAVSGNELAKFAKIVIDKTVSYNTGAKYTVEESIFDADDVHEISNIENFSHLALFHELDVETNKYFLNFDIFIDDSGSMTCSYSFNNKRIQLRYLARMIAFKMHTMNLAKDIWLFASRGELFKIQPEELFSTEINGGTDISQCIIQSNKTGRPCLIITDGNDRLSEDIKYNDKVYLLCLEMSTLDNSFKEYALNKQVLFYDSRRGFTEASYDPTANEWNRIHA